MTRINKVGFAKVGPTRGQSAPSPSEAPTIIRDAVAYSDLFRPLKDLAPLLWPRLRNALGRKGLNCLGDIAQLRQRDLLLTPGVGERGMAVLKQVLADAGLKLGIYIVNWAEVRARHHRKVNTTGQAATAKPQAVEQRGKYSQRELLKLAAAPWSGRAGGEGAATASGLRLVASLTMRRYQKSGWVDPPCNHVGKRYNERHLWQLRAIAALHAEGYVGAALGARMIGLSNAALKRIAARRPERSEAFSSHPEFVKVVGRILRKPARQLKGLGVLDINALISAGLVDPCVSGVKGEPKYSTRQAAQVAAITRLRGQGRSREQIRDRLAGLSNLVLMFIAKGVSGLERPIAWADFKARQRRGAS